MSYLKISSFLQGLYCISVNCMDNAEAQFTTALRVRLFFPPNSVSCGCSVWERTWLWLLCGSLEGKSGDSGQENLLPAKYQVPKLWFIHRGSKLRFSVWLRCWCFVSCSSLRIKSCGRSSWPTWPACTSGRATGTKRWAGFPLILKSQLPWRENRRCTWVMLVFWAFSQSGALSGRYNSKKFSEEILTLYAKFCKVWEGMFLYKTWCLGSKWVWKLLLLERLCYDWTWTSKFECVCGDLHCFDLMCVSYKPTCCQKCWWSVYVRNADHLSFPFPLVALQLIGKDKSRP